MYKLLIVDDEKEIREGLFAWPWETVGIEAAGCCSHGLEALQFIEDQPVDIVLTDIRMPFMDGLELMALLAKRYPFIRVVILSGYSDFEYAQKGLQHGAVDYLLKPLQFQQLHQSMARLVERLREEKQAEWRVSVLKRKAELLTHVLRRQFLRRLFGERMTDEEIEQAGAEGEAILEGGRFTVAIIRPDRLAEGAGQLKDRDRRLMAFALDNLLADLWDAKELGYHWVDEAAVEAYLLCARGDAHAEVAALLPQWAKYRGLFRSTFSAGIGRTVEARTEIVGSARTARQALQRSDRPSSLVLYDADRDPGEPDGERPDEGAAEGSGGASGEADSLILEQAKQFMLNNYNRSLTADEVAACVHVSTSHLFALFKQAGETYLKFLTAVRLREATRLLTTTNLKIYEIVEKVGYSDPAYFTEIFKKYMGRTPNACRNKSKF